MKKLLIFLMLLPFGKQLMAQQEMLYTQYLISPMSYNPAYTGSRDNLSFLGHYRYQWVNIEGAPRTWNINAHSPLKGTNLAIGLNLNSDKVGVLSRTDFQPTASYRIELDNSNLQFGLSATLRNVVANWSQVSTTLGNDQAFLGQDVNKWNVNFGAGAYWFNQVWGVGVSLPYIREVSMNLADVQVPSYLLRHWYSMAYYTIDINEDVAIRPSAFFKYSPRAPMQLDLSGAIIYQDVMKAALSIRNLETLAAMVQFFPRGNWSFGYSYDYSINGLNPYNGGSHEVFVGFDLRNTKSSVQSPRYF